MTLAVTGTVPEGFPLKVTPLVDRTPQLTCPLLGLFGNDDQFPSAEQVDDLEPSQVTFSPNIKEVLHKVIYSRLNPLKVCCAAFGSRLVEIVFD